ncbi:MAG TPA: hypothetical protein VK711_03915 [Puia sp.]|nr:hypothetical protein [Puia sp.]
MAQIRDNIVMKNMSGAIGKQLVFRKVNGKTIVCKYPNRSHVVYTEEQIGYRSLFARASVYASSIIKDPAKKAAYKRHGETSVYHSAIKDFMDAERKNKTGNQSES